MKKNYQFIIPLIIFLSLSSVLTILLLKERRQIPPSALLNSPIPSFSAESLIQPTEILTEKKLLGTPALINIWATWCNACMIEHKFLLKLASQGIIIHGINYKDERHYALEWLKKIGNPYQEIIFDKSGYLGILFGIYGAPETFLIDKNGIVKYHHMGILDEDIWQKKILPEYKPLGENILE